MELLTRSLRAAPVIAKDGYQYVVHPVTDGIPAVEPELLREIVDGIREVAALDDVERIVAPESMGIHHATALSLATDIPFTVIRKQSYGFEHEVAVHQTTGYSEGELFINGVEPGDRVLFVDDMFSTGGTFRAVHSALSDIGAELVDAVVVLKRGTTDEDVPVEVKSLVELDVVDGEVVIAE